MATSTPKILLLSLEKEPWHHELMGRLLAKIRAKATIIEAEDTPSTMRALSTDPPPHAILVADAGITESRHSNIAHHVAEYARTGGTVVLGCMMSSFSTPPDFDKMMKDVFRMQWQFGHYTRDDSILDGFALAAKLEEPTTVTLPVAINVKAVWLSDTAKIDRVYSSNVYPKNQATVAFARMEKGFLGWVGDVNHEEKMDAVYLALLLSAKRKEEEVEDEEYDDQDFV